MGSDIVSFDLDKIVDTAQQPRLENSNGSQRRGSLSSRSEHPRHQCQIPQVPSVSPYSTPLPPFDRSFSLPKLPAYPRPALWLALFSLARVCILVAPYPSSLRLLGKHKELS